MLIFESADSSKLLKYPETYERSKCSSILVAVSVENKGVNIETQQCAHKNVKKAIENLLKHNAIMRIG
jgi:hypothetical protein